ncbi:Z1 domain-containing protein [Paenibacillus sp. S02]|uniref:Z1 domain-containing protein n=1 Tax=Paenibacillus sp. S02 TaxID=2823904 RepID=UPI001C64ED16|nr:Z1 domain-containing protein [Paenibacillus sp. S02]QYK65738.1 Z1 domain protein [Paenibacillus sp. S02]
MDTNSYQAIKNFILKKLQDVEGVLPEDKIKEEIQNAKTIISTVGISMFSMILSVSDLIEPSKEDWLRMERELETHFDVRMEAGILVQGEEQQKRDTTWWTGKVKQECSGYYWKRYKDHMSRSMAPEVVKTTDEDTDRVMDNIENPMNDSIQAFERLGMVVGHVQSGKTGNYSALVCKAADAGYKFIVVIAGGMNNLRDQTQVRMNEAFIGQDKGIPVGVGKLGDMRSEMLPISLTTAEQDFNKRDADRNKQGINLDNISTPILLVIKKNSNTLKNVIDWLKTQYRGQIAKHAMLMIDDESDYASINTSSEEDPTIINKRLRELLRLFHKSAYVAYTATPYANIFIDHEASNDDVGKDIFPKDFIYALKAPTNYFGAAKIFLDPKQKNIVKIKDYSKSLPITHKKGEPISELPDSLYDAVRHFFVNVAIRKLRGQGDKHNSMLVHVTRFTAIHERVSSLIKEYVEKMQQAVNAYGRLDAVETQHPMLQDLKDTFALRYSELEFEWKKVLHSMVDIVSSIIVREVHNNTKIPLVYRNDTATNAIVIGGTSLSRGYTVEGLSISYFIRSTVFYDTLMQMGRWFGYRPNYEDLCYIYMPEEVATRFRLIIEATEDLVDDLNRMAKAKMTPEDFGLSVKYHPDSGLQVTARNKQKSSKDLYFEMKLDGTLKETSWIPSNPISNKKNFKLIKSLVDQLEDKYGAEKWSDSIETENTFKSYLWKNVHKEVIEYFLDHFEVVVSDQFGLNSRMPIEFVQEYVRKMETEWDVALYNGSSEKEFVASKIKTKQERRKFTHKVDHLEVRNRQVSSGSAEFISLSEEERQECGNDRKAARSKLKRPLLMLHIMDGEISLEENGQINLPSQSDLAAFGISFPGGIESGKRTVKVKINSVTIKNLLNETEEDFDDNQE